MKTVSRFTCQQCGVGFDRYARPADIASGRVKFCGRACAGLSQWGKPGDHPLTAAELEAWFWSMVNKDGPIPEHRPELGPCWIWTGSTSRAGYGWINRGSIRMYAHRYASILSDGPFARGIRALHHCDNPPCVRHLFRGTQADNMRDMIAKGRNFHVTHPETLTRGDRHRSRTSPETIPRGEEHGMAKLSETKVREILSLFADGETQSGLARRFDVSITTVHSIVRGKTWAHVSQN